MKKVKKKKLVTAKKPKTVHKPVSDSPETWKVTARLSQIRNEINAQVSDMVYFVGDKPEKVTESVYRYIEKARQESYEDGRRTAFWDVGYAVIGLTVIALLWLLWYLGKP